VTCVTCFDCHTGSQSRYIAAHIVACGCTHDGCAYKRITWQAPSDPVELQVAPQPGCTSEPVSPMRIFDSGSGAPPGVACPSANAATCKYVKSLSVLGWFSW
jgi:hypothetical protein